MVSPCIESLSGSMANETAGSTTTTTTTSGGTRPSFTSHLDPYQLWREWDETRKNNEALWRLVQKQRVVIFKLRQACVRANVSLGGSCGEKDMAAKEGEKGVENSGVEKETIEGSGVSAAAAAATSTTTTITTSASPAIASTLTSSPTNPSPAPDSSPPSAPPLHTSPTPDTLTPPTPVRDPVLPVRASSTTNPIQHHQQQASAPAAAKAPPRLMHYGSFWEQLPSPQSDSVPTTVVQSPRSLTNLTTDATTQGNVSRPSTSSAKVGPGPGAGRLPVTSIRLPSQPIPQSHEPLSASSVPGPSGLSQFLGAMDALPRTGRQKKRWSAMPMDHDQWSASPLGSNKDANDGGASVGNGVSEMEATTAPGAPEVSPAAGEPMSKSPLIVNSPTERSDVPPPISEITVTPLHLNLPDPDPPLAPVPPTDIPDGTRTAEGIYVIPPKPGDYLKAYHIPNLQVAEMTLSSIPETLRLKVVCSMVKVVGSAAGGGGGGAGGGGAGAGGGGGGGLGKGKDVPVLVYILHVSAGGAGGRNQMSWLIEKSYADLLHLDMQLRNAKTDLSLRPVPAKDVLTSLSPAKSLRRKYFFEAYLKQLAEALRVVHLPVVQFLLSNLYCPPPYRDVSDPRFPPQEVRKEGYLVKRSKHRSWKARYLILLGTSLMFYDSKEGNQSGSAVDFKSSSSSQVTALDAEGGGPHLIPDSDEVADLHEQEYRHAFVLTPDTRKPSTQHILCAQDDWDRDEWVKALQTVITTTQRNPPFSSSDRSTRNHPPLMLASPTGTNEQLAPSTGIIESAGPGRRLLLFPPSSQDDGESPDSAYSTQGSSANHSSAPGTPATASQPSLASSSTTTNHNYHYTTAASSSSTSSINRPPMSPALSDDSRVWQYRLDTQSSAQHPPPPPSPFRSPASRDHLLPSKIPKKVSTTAARSDQSTARMRKDSNPLGSTSSSNSRMTTFFFKKRGTAIAATQGFPTRKTFFSRSSSEKSAAHHTTSTASATETSAMATPSRSVFGVPLEESLAVAKLGEQALPAVVYRCIAFLDAHQAEKEEGIYRLSGTSTTIRSLRERFDRDGDYDLLGSGKPYDVHAIAGLLKLYLRELPSSILTREMHHEFLRVRDNSDKQARILQLSRLLSRLPYPNYALLRALIAHLMRIVQHSNFNKMTLRNVGIVFSPTLGIPAGVFTLLMTDFEEAFDGPGADAELLSEPNIDSPPRSKAHSRTFSTPDHIMASPFGDVVDRAFQGLASDAPVPSRSNIAHGKLADQALRRVDQLQMNRNSVMYSESVPEGLRLLETQANADTALTDYDFGDKETLLGSRSSHTDQRDEFLPPFALTAQEGLDIEFNLTKSAAPSVQTASVETVGWDTESSGTKGPAPDKPKVDLATSVTSLSGHLNPNDRALGGVPARSASKGARGLQYISGIPRLQQERQAPLIASHAHAPSQSGSQQQPSVSSPV